jgi:hypothetical protein
MRYGWMGVPCTAAILLCVFGGQAGARAFRPPVRAGAAQGASNHATELRKVLASLGDKHGTKILIDPGLIVPATPASPAAGATLAKALDSLVAAVPGAAWRCVYLQLSPNASLPEASRVSDWVRALDRLTQVGMVVENVGNGRATVLMKEYPISKTYRSDLARAQYRTVYVVYRASGRATPSEDSATKPAKAEPGQVAEVLGDMLGAFFSLDAESQKLGMQQAMGLLFSIDPGSRAEFVTQLWTSLSPDQRAELARMVMRVGFDGPGP